MTFSMSAFFFLVDEDRYYFVDETFAHGLYSSVDMTDGVCTFMYMY